MSGCSDSGAMVAATPSMIVEENWGARRKKFMVPVVLLLLLSCSCSGRLAATVESWEDHGLAVCS